MRYCTCASADMYLYRTLDSGSALGMHRSRAAAAGRRAREPREPALAARARVLVDAARQHLVQVDAQRTAALRLGSASPRVSFHRVAELSCSYDLTTAHYCTALCLVHGTLYGGQSDRAEFLNHRNPH